jgi:hypothetical protein
MNKCSRCGVTDALQNFIACDAGFLHTNDELCLAALQRQSAALKELLRECYERLPTFERNSDLLRRIESALRGE